MTAVSVRRMFGPSEISRNPPACAAESSSSVQPPSGPTASSADAAAFCSSAVFFPSRAERRGGASGRSDRRSCSRSPALGVATRAPRSSNADEGRVEGCNTGGRMRPPVLHPSTRPSSAFELLGARVATPSAGDRLQLLLSERPDAPPLRSALEGKKTALEQKAAASALLAVGPEGGWTDEELSAARAGGFLEISLGPNILRTETAVIAALAALSYALGD